MSDLVKEKKKIEKPKYKFKDVLVLSMLTALALTVMFLLYGMIDFYANNMYELGFSFKEAILPILEVFITGFLIVFAICFVLSFKILNIVSSCVFSFIFTVYIFNAFISKAIFVSGSYYNDGQELNEYIYLILCFVAIFTILFFISVRFSSKWKSVVIFMSILVLGMNLSALASDFFTTDIIKATPKKCEYVLTDKDMLTVSKKENVIIILFDRFDTQFFEEVIEDTPDYFDELDGFTYFDNTTSVYSRTFPAVTAMITGVDYDGSCTPNEYFDNAYSNSPFLKDLKANDYAVNLYCHRYYTYDDAVLLNGVADNAEKVSNYKIDKKLMKSTLSLWAFTRFFPRAASDLMLTYTSSGTFSKICIPQAENNSYYPNDIELNKKLKESGLSLNDNDRQFTYIYMQGCHSPYFLDENCEPSDNATSLSQTKGGFGVVKNYIRELKRLGVYDDCTIVITGDHGFPESDVKNYLETNTNGVATTMLIKPKNASFKSYRKSSAPTSISNINATIIEDAGIDTDHDYGLSAFSIKESDEIKRYSLQSIYDSQKKELILDKFAIEGSATDLKSWTLVESIKTNQKWY